MISYIKGELTEVFDEIIVVENNGIGYNIRVPASLLSRIPRVGTDVKVYTYLYVREDAMNLYGFLTRDDLDVFKLLITVNGIGPKGALGILSTITPDELRFAVLSDDVKLISRAPGIGSKTAQKLIIELKDKLKLEDAFEKKLMHNNEEISIDLDGKNEAIQALVALGYGSAEAIKAVKQVEHLDEKDSESILKEALKKLTFL
jgi:Holliday junction DNA helicase RuvA